MGARDQDRLAGGLAGRQGVDPAVGPADREAPGRITPGVHEGDLAGKLLDETDAAVVQDDHVPRPIDLARALPLPEDGAHLVSVTVVDAHLAHLGIQDIDVPVAVGTHTRH